MSHSADRPPTAADGLAISDEEREREATELHSYAASTSTELEHPAGAGASRQPVQPVGIRSASKSFWQRQVVATVPHEACRDHFALERTYLGYFRTSLALAFLGVIVAQLFRLQHNPNPDPKLGFFVLGIPLSCMCTGAAIVVNLLGTYRFWRQQNAMLRGKVHCGGWEMHVILAVIFLVELVITGLVVAVDIRRG